MSKITRILIALAFSLLVVSAIFFFSEQSGGESHEVSGKVAAALAKAITAQSGHEFTEREYKTLENALEHPVRKFAHLSIYFGLGLVLYLSALFIQKDKRHPILIAICLIIVMLVASADEINQFFKEDRGSSVSDVLLDTFGGALGIYFYYIVTDFAGHVRKLFHKEGDKEH